MAWSITNLENGNSGSATNSKTTGSLSIPANSLVVLFAHGSNNGTGWNTAAITVTDSVDGATGWTGLDSMVNLGNNTFDGAGRMFYKSFTSGTTRTITVARSGGSATAYWGYDVVSVTGHDTGNPIVQAKGTGTQFSPAGNSYSQGVTLASNPTSGNAVIWFLGVNNDNTGAATMPSGYSVLANPSGTVSATSAAYHTSTTTATISSSDVGELISYAIAAAVELLPAGTGNGSGVSAWLVA